MNYLKFIFLGLGLLLWSNSVWSQNQWNIQLSQSSLDCNGNQVCYDLELQNTSGANWALGDQNYRLFYDGDIMTITSVTSLLSSSFYGAAVIDQDLKISGQGQEVASPLDDIDDNLGFLDFSIIQTDKSNPGGTTQITTGAFSEVAQICVAVTDITANDCLTFYHSRPATAGSITSQYTVISENDAPGSTTITGGVGYDDLTPMDGNESCFDDACAATAAKQWDTRFIQTYLSCTNNKVCYQLQVASSVGDWVIGDQNYFLFFDGDLMTVTGVQSLLPDTTYGQANINQNIKVSGQGQETASPLDDIDDNLGFLDFSIAQTDIDNPNEATLLPEGIFISIAEICLDVIDVTANDCLTFYHSRPSTAGTFTNQHSIITENDAPNSNALTEGNSYDDLNVADGNLSCFDDVCTFNQWNIQVSQSNIDCNTRQVCYQLEVAGNASSWVLSDQNYRLFFDGDLMTIQSVTSLLSPAFYSNANIDQNIKINGQGQEAYSPLDGIDSNLGFLDFSITQTDKSNPTNAPQIADGIFTAVAEICLEATEEAINDLSGTKCLSLYHSRPSTAGGITNQYTTITENNTSNNTTQTTGSNYLDLTPYQTTDACLGSQCNCDATGQVLSRQ